MERKIILLAHNIRSLWNVGAFFRTADAFGVEKIYLTGYTGLPPRREISKTALGADEWIPWEHQDEPKNVIAHLKSEGWQIAALERTEQATNIASFSPAEKVCLLVGHEVTGVPQELLDACDVQIEIPMHGKKESLNVSVAAGIALYRLREC
ncbi:RNA methyltransferase [Candidatus Peregrinibacteria bacterium CG10_big_fil_rev_8_21_14_0_10_49_10]|nr:MAG: RNA methyltransferase [Candidatus Peregrinibacteria bacterium CG10_big_fil_rev_8_21_14_0_10_49_10]